MPTPLPSIAIWIVRDELLEYELPWYWKQQRSEVRLKKSYRFSAHGVQGLASSYARRNGSIPEEWKQLLTETNKLQKVLVRKETVPGKVKTFFQMRREAA